MGVALRLGHPVYFVVFFPDPCPGQTLAEVLHALRRFVEEVTRGHPGKPPGLYGNCQAVWAIAILSAHCAELQAGILNNLADRTIAKALRGRTSRLRYAEVSGL